MNVPFLKKFNNDGNQNIALAVKANNSFYYWLGFGNITSFFATLRSFLPLNDSNQLPEYRPFFQV